MLVSWKKDRLPTAVPFTIGQSSIGGSDAIASEGALVSDWNQYRYYDETPQLVWMDWERGYNMPTGGLTKALADVVLDNTSRRYTPDYMGGHSELWTSILPRRPIVINAGFDHDGILDYIPQFVGVLTKAPMVGRKSGQAKLMAADFIDYLQNRALDRQIMFTGLRTDEVMETMLQEMGFATSQYDLDMGINRIPFGLFETGTKFADMFNQLAQAENGHFYQNEEGVLIFENRTHWNNNADVQAILATSQVLDAEYDGSDHIVNVVEINSKVYEKQPEQIIFTLAGAIELAAGSQDVFFDFMDPALSMTTPSISGASYYIANTQQDGGGTDVSGSVSITSSYNFARSGRLTFSNATGGTVFLTQLVVTGRVAKNTSKIYTRIQDDSSVTAYEEQVLTINNDYIQDQTWANSYAQMILNDFSDPENLQTITIRAMPQLSIGDLISWQGRYWRIWDIKTTMSVDNGFVQELKLLQRTPVSYFTIGESTIGGSDKIAP